MLTPWIEFVSAIAMAATLLVGNMNGMNLGDFAALATAMYLCSEPVKKLGAVHNKAETLNAGPVSYTHLLPDGVIHELQAHGLAADDDVRDFLRGAFTDDGDKNQMQFHYLPL